MQVHVPEAARGAGFGAALRRACDAWAASHSLTHTELFVDADDPGAVDGADEGLDRHRSTLVSSSLDVTRAKLPVGVTAPDGVGVLPLGHHHDLEVGMYAVAMEAEPDITPDDPAEAPPFDAWRVDAFPVNTLREGTMLAVVEKTVVGFALLAVGGVAGVAHHRLTGVARDHRGRGVGGALKRAQVAWAQASAIGVLRTANLEGSAMEAINRRLGYLPTRRQRLMLGPVRR